MTSKATTFRTIEEARQWVKANLVKLPSGEFALRESLDLAGTLEEKNRELGNAAEELRALRQNVTDSKETIHRLNVDLDSARSKIESFQETQTQLETYRERFEQSRILEEVRRIALARKIPRSIVENDFERLVVPELRMDENDRIVARNDPSVDAETYIRLRQQERPHWQPLSHGAEAEPGRKPTSPARSLGAVFE